MKTLKVVCAWCRPGSGDDNTTHTICRKCKAKQLAIIAKYRIKRNGAKPK